jgi:outer membrane protein assembly factor BamD
MGATARLARAATTIVALAGALGLAGCTAGIMPAVTSEADRLAQAREAMAKRHYNISIELLKSYVANNAGAARVDEAIVLLGESYLSIKEWASAQIEFERLLRDYPESDSAAAASYQLGAALWGQARKPDFDQEFTRRALAQWESYRRAYPDHWRAGEADRHIAEARNRLAVKLVNTGRLYLRLRLAEPARAYFQRAMDEYADTPAVGDAWIGLALADALDGKRSEAIERLRRIEAEHPGTPLAARAAEERSRIER